MDTKTDSLSVSDALIPVLRGMSWRSTTDSDKFLVSSGYKHVTKSFKGFIAEPTEQFWARYKPYKAHLKAIGVHLTKLTTGEWVVFTKKTFDEVLAAAVGVDCSKATSASVELLAPDGLEYLPFQKAGVAFSLTHGNVLFGDEMGLGKTIQAIGAINNDASIKSVLVVVPAYLKINWKREIEKWSVRRCEVAIIDAGMEWPNWSLNSGDELLFYIVNYEILPRYVSDLPRFDACILDECHYIKSSNAKRTRAVMDLKNKVRRWFALSGTPALNRPIELFTVLNLLSPQTFPNYYAFAKRYCGGTDNGWGFEAKGCTNADELQMKMRGSVLVRRLKNDVLTELPPKRRQIIELPAIQAVQTLLDEEKRIWRLHEETIASLRERQAMAEINDDDDEYIEAGKLIAREYSVSFAEMAKIRAMLAEHKVPLVHQQVLDAIEGGVQKPIVFFHHKSPLRVLGGLLEKEKLPHWRVDGNSKLEERQACVDAFMNHSGEAVLLGTIGAMGTGYNITCSSNVIFGELDWRPGILSQAEDRTHRIGQSQSVLVQYLLFADSLDAKMISTVIDKMSNLRQVMDETSSGGDEDELALDDEVKPKQRRPLKGIQDAEQRGLIHEALRILAGFDPDRARGQNNIGFNKFDSFIGHRLSSEHALSPRAAAVGKNIIKKYRRQLDGLWERIFPIDDAS